MKKLRSGILVIFLVAISSSSAFAIETINDKALYLAYDIQQIDRDLKNLLINPYITQQAAKEFISMEKSLGAVSLQLKNISTDINNAQKINYGRVGNITSQITEISKQISSLYTDDDIFRVRRDATNEEIIQAQRYKQVTSGKIERCSEELSGSVLELNKKITGNMSIREKSRKIESYAKDIALDAEIIGSYAKNPYISSQAYGELEQVSSGMLDLFNKASGVNSKEKAAEVAGEIDEAWTKISATLFEYRGYIKGSVPEKLREIRKNLYDVSVGFKKLASDKDKQIDNTLSKIKLPAINNAVSKP